MENETEELSDMNHLPLWTFVLAALCFFIIGVIATVAVALSTSTTRRSATTLLVINLTASILPICTLTMPFITALCFEKVFWKNRYISSNSMKAFYIITSICNQVELHTITALAFNRACAVSLPSFYKQYLNKPLVIWTSLALIWIYSTVLWIPVSVGVWGVLEVHTDKYFIEVKDESATRPSILIFFCFILPFLITVVCHFVMFCKFRRSRFLKAENMIRPWKNHVTRAMTLLFVLQCLFSIPHFIAHILKRRGSWPRLWLYIHIFYFTRFCLNPFIYIYSSRHYKRDILRVLKNLYFFERNKEINSINMEINLETMERLTCQPSSKETVDAV